MNIYIAHSTSFDFKEELYSPIRSSILDQIHSMTLPHENTSDLFDSKTHLQTCDLMIAEVSYPSTGVGIELGWADMFGCNIVCIKKIGSTSSSSLEAVCKNIFEYGNHEELVKAIQKAIDLV